jgi:hypothetical protein
LKQELENAQAQMEVFKRMAEENRVQVIQVLKLTEGRKSEGEEKELEEKGNEIAQFSGTDRKELRGWKVQLALKIVGKPKTFNTEHKKLRYAVGRLDGLAMAQLMPYCDKVSGEVKVDSLKDLIDILYIAFGDQDKVAEAKRELLRLKQ